MGLNGFLRTADILHKAMDVNALRYNVTSNNLANSDVPGFKRTVVNFESELKRAFDSEKNADGAFELAVTHPLHIKSHDVIDYRTVQPRRVLDYLTEEKANGNNVNPEEEAMNVLKIQMQYQLLSMMVGFHYNQAQSVLK